MMDTNVDALKELCAAIATKVGESVSPADDSTTIAICEVDSSGSAIAGGTVFVSVNLG